MHFCRLAGVIGPVPRPLFIRYLVVNAIVWVFPPRVNPCGKKTFRDHHGSSAAGKDVSPGKAVPSSVASSAAASPPAWVTQSATAVKMAVLVTVAPVMPSICSVNVAESAAAP